MAEFVVAVCLVLCPWSEAANVGTGFGETLWALTSARQAGTGGLMLEDPWREGAQVEASTVILQPGARWVGLGCQAGVGPALRLGGEGFVFQSATVSRTLELSDGSFGGTQGSVSAQEWGGRVVGQLMVWSRGDWRVAGLGRVSGVFQRLPDVNHVGAMAEGGAVAERLLGSADQALTAWGLMGPLGWGAGRFSTWQISGGVGWLNKMADGWVFPGAEGCGVGMEGDILGEQLLHGGVGGVYWFGRPDDAGPTLFVRAGIRSMSGTAREVQPRGGVGLLWNWRGGLGLQFDYAVVPLGDLGLLHYGTLSLRRVMRGE